MVLLNGTKTTPRKLARSLVNSKLEMAVAEVQQDLQLDPEMTDRERTLVQEQVVSVVEMLQKKLGTASNGHTDEDTTTV